VLHDGHELDDIVPKVTDARQDVVGELFVCRDFAVGRGDSDVGLVDAGALGLRGALVLENVLVGRVPETGIVDGGDIEVLGDAGDPGGEALLAGVVVGNDKGDLEGQRCAELRRDRCSTLSLESWGIAGWPLTPGTVTSKTPYSSFFMGVASRSQLLKSPIR
jgi:hypothetical protein